MQRGYLSDCAALRLGEIVDDCARGARRKRQVFAAKAFQRCHAEMIQQRFARPVRVKGVVRSLR